MLCKIDFDISIDCGILKKALTLHYKAAGFYGYNTVSAKPLFAG